MDDSQRAKFIHVYDLLTQVAGGIGVGNRALIASATTPVGTLAVKEADVSVEFTMSSAATSTAIQGPSLGANTLFGASVTQSSDSSRASITLKIVPIPAVAPETDTTTDTGKPGAGGFVPKPGVVWGGGTTPVPGPNLIGAFGDLMDKLKDDVAPPGSAETAATREMIAEIDRVKAAMKSGNPAGAIAALRKLIKRPDR